MWHKVRFELMWMSHGGQGLGLTFEDCENLDYADVQDLMGRVIERREAEAKAIQSATNAPKKQPV